MPNDGRWMSTVRLIKVNRSPVTREWTAEQKHASGDKAIWVESGDSVGFSMGFTCTAFIDEKDAATFLYWYPSGSLANVMDTEVRAASSRPLPKSPRNTRSIRCARRSRKSLTP